MGQQSEIFTQIDEWKGKVDSDDYEELMHEQSEEGTAPDNDSDDDCRNDFLGQSRLQNLKTDEKTHFVSSNRK